MAGRRFPTILGAWCGSATDMNSYNALMAWLGPWCCSRGHRTWCTLRRCHGAPSCDHPAIFGLILTTYRYMYNHMLYSIVTWYIYIYVLNNFIYIYIHQGIVGSYELLHVMGNFSQGTVGAASEQWSSWNFTSSSYTTLYWARWDSNSFAILSETGDTEGLRPGKKINITYVKLRVSVARVDPNLRIFSCVVWDEPDPCYLMILAFQISFT